MAEDKGTTKNTEIDSEDPDLVDASTEDDSKDNAELWDEFEQADSADPDAIDDEQPAKAAGSEDDGEQDSAEDDDEPDDSSASEQEAHSGPSGETPDDAKPQDEIWANATPEQKAAYEAAEAKMRKLEQADRSNRGRLSALQRQINAMAKQQHPAKKEPEAVASDLDDEQLKKVAEDYPEVAKPFIDVIGKQQAALRQQGETLARLEKGMSAIDEDRQQTALEEQESLLMEKHPDWADLATPEFAQWVYTQPRHIQEAAHRNGDGIVDAAEAIDLMDRYKAHLGVGKSNESTQSGNGRVTNSNKQLSGKRQRQLESAKTARSRSPGVVSGIAEDGDPEQIWDQFEAEERRQQRAS